MLRRKSKTLPSLKRPRIKNTTSKRANQLATKTASSSALTLSKESFLEKEVDLNLYSVGSPVLAAGWC